MVNNGFNLVEQSIFTITSGKINLIGAYKELEHDSDF